MKKIPVCENCKHKNTYYGEFTFRCSNFYNADEQESDQEGRDCKEDE